MDSEGRDVGVVIGEVELDGVLDVTRAEYLDGVVDELEVLKVEVNVLEAVELAVVFKDNTVVLLGATVFVLPNPETPMIVCASPAGIEKTPCPLLQSQAPAFTDAWQHHSPPPHEYKDPSLDELVSSITSIRLVAAMRVGDGRSLY
jgi:hypothetical protein